MTTKEEKEAKANAAIKPYVPISSSDMLLLEKDGIEEDDEDEVEGEEELILLSFSSARYTILAVGETVALFVICSATLLHPTLKLAK